MSLNAQTIKRFSVPDLEVYIFVEWVFGFSQHYKVYYVNGNACTMPTAHLWQAVALMVR